MKRTIISYYVQYAGALIASFILGMEGVWSWFWICLFLAIAASACAVYVTFNPSKK